MTAKVLAQAKGPKIRIGKYKKRTGYKRHTGFRASLTQIEIESIGGEVGARAKRARAGGPAEDAPRQEDPEGLPEGYADLTVAEIKDAAAGWDAARSLRRSTTSRRMRKRKGAIAALESAGAEGDG